METQTKQKILNNKFGLRELLKRIKFSPILKINLAIAIFFCLVLSVNAAHDTMMSLQGKVINSSGNLIDGDLGVNISTQNDCNTGVIFAHIYANEIQKGIFDILLGETDSLSLDYNKDYYLCTYANGELVNGPYKFRGGQGQIHESDVNFSSLTIGGNLTVAGTSLTVNTKEVCLSDGTNCQSQSGMDYTNLAMINKSNTFGAFNQTFDTNTFFINAENDMVGIGTTGPGAKLDVSEDIKTQSKAATAIQPALFSSHSGISFTNDANSQSVIAYGYEYDGSKPIFRVAAKPYTTDVRAAWDPSAKTRLIVLGDGKVGIGTTAPTGLLNLRGYTGGTGGSALATYNKTLVIGGAYNQFYNSLNANLLWIGDYSNDAGDNVYPIYVESENNNVDFYVKAGTTGGIGSAYFGGNVGIGTTVPSSLLDVRGNVSLNNTLYIITSGNVGIGTATPSQKLHILRNTATTAPVVVIEEDSTSGYATLQLDRASTARSSFVQFSTGGTGDWIMGHGYDGGVANSDFGIFQGNSANPDIDTAILRVKSNGNTIIQSGNVGIGTTSPTEKLNVVGNANITGNVSSNGRNLNTYVVRNPTNWDFTSFTTNGSWINDGLDLSSIIPAGTKAVHLRVQVRDDTAGSTFSVRQSSTNAYNQFSVVSPGNYLLNEGEIIAIDTDRKLDYQASNVVWEAKSIVVLGWYV